ncbi:MAG TPA: cyclic lactone autoinducer peptide [Ruminiclostridium sp.]|jgi:cyclic lactone autoinducer peptide|nr:cyclic lactone autoinducer peptide [Ruminiclostridium sp.]
MMKRFAFLGGKVLAAMALSIAFLSNYAACVVFVNQPPMPEKVRMLKK